MCKFNNEEPNGTHRKDRIIHVDMCWPRDFTTSGRGEREALAMPSPIPMDTLHVLFLLGVLNQFLFLGDK